MSYPVRAVRFRQRFGSYNSGEVATFGTPTAAQYVSAGFATWAPEADEESTPAPTPAQTEALAGPPEAREVQPPGTPSGPVQGEAEAVREGNLSRTKGPFRKKG